MSNISVASNLWKHRGLSLPQIQILEESCISPTEYDKVIDIFYFSEEKDLEKIMTCLDIIIQNSIPIEQKRRQKSA